MKRIAVVTDSVAALPKHLSEELGIHTVPILIYWDGQTYRDGDPRLVTSYSSIHA